MLSALLLAVALAAEGEDQGADAQPPATPAALAPQTAPEAAPPVLEAEPLPTSFALYLSLIEPYVQFGGVSSIAGTVRIGVVLEGRHALLIGLGANATIGGPFPTTTVLATPAYRYHFAVLAPGALSPFVQAELVAGFSHSTINLGGGSSSDSFIFGGGLGGGGEYLFVRGFGVALSAGLRLTRNEAVSQSSQSTTNVGFWGSAALAMHF